MVGLPLLQHISTRRHLSVEEKLTGQTTSYLPWITMVGIWRLDRKVKFVRTIITKVNIHLIDFLLLQELTVSHKALARTGYLLLSKDITENTGLNLIDKIMILYTSKRAERNNLRNLAHKFGRESSGGQDHKLTAQIFHLRRERHG